MKRAILTAGLVASAAATLVFAQPARFDDVVRNLRNPEPKVRLERGAAAARGEISRRRSSRSPRSSPIRSTRCSSRRLAPSCRSSWSKTCRRGGGSVSWSKCATAAARRRRSISGRSRRGPARPRPRWSTALLQAVDDENARVRLEAIYAAGVDRERRRWRPAPSERLIKALDHYDPAVRTAAARVAGRLGVKAAGDALIKAVNDSNAEVRYASMRALGAIRDDARGLRADRTARSFYGKGEGAWSALDAWRGSRTRRACRSSRSAWPIKDPFIRRAAAEGLGRPGDSSAATRARNRRRQRSVQHGPGRHGLRAAEARAQLRAPPDRVPGRRQDDPAGAGIPHRVRAGRSRTTCCPACRRPTPASARASPTCSAQIGGDASLAALRAVKDGNKDVTTAASRAVERIKIRRGQ